MEEKIEKATKKTGISKQNIIFIIGVIGILLVGFAQFPMGEKEVDLPKEVKSTYHDYGKELEAQLVDILGSIEGVGRVKVMVTMESSYAYEYATENRTDIDRSSDNREEQGEKTQEKNTVEETYVMIENSDGETEGLIKREIAPTLKGILVVCDGGGDPLIETCVTEMVSVAANLSTAKIAVSKMTV